MNAWILIVYFWVGAGGYQAGQAVNFQEFNSKQSCEYAKLRIEQKTLRGKNDRIEADVIGECVAK